MPQLLADLKCYHAQSYVVSVCAALNIADTGLDVYKYITVNLTGPANDNYAAIIEAAKFICCGYPNAIIDWVDTDVIQVSDVGVSSKPIYTKIWEVDFGNV